MKYELTKEEIDVISLALKTRIDYLKGIIMLNEQFMKENPEQLALHKAMLRMAEEVQEKTTYMGQSNFCK